MLDKIKGALFGLAIGDALGGTTEFMTPIDIKKKYGYLKDIIGGGVWELEPGETTDDTAMTLAVAEGILDSPRSPLPSIGKRFLKWYHTLPKDVGTTVRMTMYFKEQGLSWGQAAEITNNYMKGKSSGNGSLMRCLPVALAYRDRMKMEDITVKQSKMTHYASEASEACLLYNRIAHDVLWKGYPLRSAIKRNVNGTRYSSILYRNPSHSPGGYVVETLMWVLAIAYSGRNLEEGVQALANMGDDSDTAAAITGGLLGLEEGFRSLPKRYVNAILEKNRLNRVAERLVELHERK